MKKIALALGGLALVTAPVVAQTAPVIAPVADENEISGNGAGLFAAAMIAGIATMAILVFTDGDDDPVSP